MFYGIGRMKYVVAQLSLWPEARSKPTNLGTQPRLIIRLCAHILEGGRLCRQPAVEGRRHCRHHIVLQVRRHRMARARRRAGCLHLPALTDARGVEAGLARVRSALAAGYIEPERARSLAYLLHTVAYLDRRIQADYEDGAAAHDRAAAAAKSNRNYEVAAGPVSSRGYTINSS